MEIQLALNADTDGFISQECPACRMFFKIAPGQGSSGTLSFCPYCGHHGTDCWWTPDQAEYLSSVAADQFLGPQLESMARAFNRGNRGDFLRTTMRVSRSKPVSPPDEPNGEMIFAEFTCCGERIKHVGGKRSLNCVICGRTSEVG